jgi:hypothetical protein
MPRCGIVFARLIVNGDNRGVRPFIVAIGDGKNMCKNIISQYVMVSLKVSCSKKSAEPYPRERVLIRSITQ